MRVRFFSRVDFRRKYMQCLQTRRLSMRKRKLNDALNVLIVVLYNLFYFFLHIIRRQPTADII